MSEENNYQLLLVPTDGSIEWNIEYKMYFCKTGTNHKQPFRYLGFCNNKLIQAMGRVENCITADYDINAGELFVHRGQDPITKEEQPVTESQKERLHKAFSDGKIPWDNVYSEHKFYVLEESDFAEIDSCKASEWPVQHFQYLNLAEYFGDKKPRNGSFQAIAELLEGKTWS